MLEFYNRRKPAKPNREQSAKQTSVLFFGAMLYTAFVLLSSSALAQTASKTSGRKDFGSETIQYMDRTKDSTEPLPLELVEEPEVEGMKVTPSSNETFKNPSQFLSNLDNNDTAALEEITTVLNGSDIELSALIKTFSKLAKRNYIVDGKVKGKVTMHLPTPVSIEEALRVFDTVLLLKGYTTIPVTENIWKVIPAKDAKQTTVPLYRASVDNPSDVLVTERIRLKHITSEDGEDLLKTFISKEGTLKSVAGSNSLLIIDSQANIARLRELLSEIDVPAVDRELTIIPINHAEAGDLAGKINEILGNDEESEANSRASNLSTFQQRRAQLSSRGRNRNSAANSDSSSGGERRTLPFKIIPDERTNSLIVVADREMTLKVQALVDQLDSELDRSAGRFWVYGLKHGDAEALAEILNNLISGAESTESSSSSTTQGSSLSRSTRASSTSNANSSSRLTRALARSRELLSRSRQGGPDGGRVSLEGEVSITADPATNSLIINASKSDYLRIKEVIDVLDAKRRQVLVEATILEVTISDTEGLGVELQGTAGIDDKGGVLTQTNFGSITNLLTNPAALTDLTIAAASSGTLTLPGGLVIPSQAVLISAVSRHSNVNVLSSPTILATDNEEAEIIVGENVPFVTSTSTDTTNIGNTFNQVERQDVGITLRITPQISSGDYVNLRMFVEISNVVNGTRNDPNGPTTTIRTTETSVEVKNDQMVITGGLIQDSLSASTRGVPFFEDIPVIGQYFKTQSDDKRKTNLLIFITPKIVGNQFEARDETKRLAKGVEEKFKEYDLVPNRSEVLSSEKIDNVVGTYKEDDLGEPSPLLPSDVRPSPDARDFIPGEGSFIEMPEAKYGIEQNFGRTSDKKHTTKKSPLAKVQKPHQSLKAIDSSGLVGDAPAPRPETSAQETLDINAKPPLARQELSRPRLKAPARIAKTSNPAEGPDNTQLDIVASPKPILPLNIPSELPPASGYKTPSNVGKKTTQSNKPGSISSTAYVVLKRVSSSGSENLKYSESENMLGLIAPSRKGLASSSHFQVGGRYTEKKDEGKFICLGVYDSAEEAAQSHASLASKSTWNSIPSSSAIDLGTKLWTQGFN